MVAAMVCERMGWDYFTYESQPTWFVKLLLRKFQIDADKQKQPASSPH